MPTRAVVARARKIRLLVMDVDGVLTDGRMMLSERGDELKAFNTHDGLAIALGQARGHPDRDGHRRVEPRSRRRGAKLGVDSVVLGAAARARWSRRCASSTTCQPRRWPSSATT
jgi:3-deoxy-D-manno-octulosonate 8-phosphate phosphatase KdsC-like HAD superfamily phosphatase